jgi:sortase A
MRAIVRGFGELLITVGALLLLFVAWQLWWTDVQANREQAGITADLHEAWRDALDQRPPVSGEPPVPAKPTPREAFAIIHIPRFGQDYQPRPVLEGTSLDLLARGVGHYEDSALPGQIGNFSIAGHRVTYGRPFNQIAELKPGDPIVIETADTWYVYRMRSDLIVTPDRVDVVAPVPEQPDAKPTERLLTLTACHPMYSARERYIVHAEFDRWQPKGAGDPAELQEVG